MTVFRVPGGPSVPVVPPPPVHRRDPDAVPVPALLAGVLGLLAAVLAALAGSFAVLLAASLGSAAAVPLAVAAALLAGSSLAGALLLLCRRSGALLVLSCLPIAGLAALLLLGDVPASLAAVPVGSGTCAVVAAVLAASAPVRRWTAARPGRRAPLREEPRWP
ncbi:hypothetical protein [Trujillonella humicola]|uniref:hypothetical protein n=1 Tax=Trujillonella humicola TaxID=3383699 RepID=UPI0039059CEF